MASSHHKARAAKACWGRFGVWHWSACWAQRPTPVTAVAQRWTGPTWRH